MTDERFEEFLRREAGQYNKPPPTPREDIWLRIKATRKRRVPKVPRVTKWMQAAVAVAAVLIVGIGIGRWSVSEGTDPEPTFIAGARASEDDIEIYRVAAMDHLDQLDMFITLFRADVGAGRADSSTAEWVHDLLTTTRLMMDSPAGEDPGLRELLEDLELVLAQIASYVDRPNENELDMLREDLDDEGILLRLKAELAINGAEMPVQGEI